MSTITSLSSSVLYKISKHRTDAPQGIFLRGGKKGIFMVNSHIILSRSFNKVVKEMLRHIQAITKKENTSDVHKMRSNVNT